MLETARFSNPFDTHELCIKPFLDAVDGWRGLARTVREFRAFDASEVAPRVRPERQRLHRLAVHPASLWLMGANEALVKTFHAKRTTYEDVVAIHTTLRKARRRLPPGMRELVHMFDHETSCEGVWGQEYDQQTYKDKDGNWQLGIRRDVIKGPLSSCE